MPSSITIRGFTPKGDAGETFSVAGGKASWKSQVDSGSAAYQAPAVLLRAGRADRADRDGSSSAILARPDKTMDLLPGGKAKAEKLTTVKVGSGANEKEVTAWAITRRQQLRRCRSGPTRTASSSASCSS